MGSDTPLLDLGAAETGRQVDAEQIQLLGDAPTARMEQALTSLIGRAAHLGELGTGARGFEFWVRATGMLVMVIRIGTQKTRVEFTREEWEEVEPTIDLSGHEEETAALVKALTPVVREAQDEAASLHAEASKLKGIAWIFDRSEESMRWVKSLVTDRPQSKAPVEAWLRGHSQHYVWKMAFEPDTSWYAEMKSSDAFTEGAIEALAADFSTPLDQVVILTEALANRQLADLIKQRWKQLGGLAWD